MRIGHGYDIHRLVTGRPLILGGVSIPFEKGLQGHSDADVLLHALMDALLSAAGLPDIGHFFPPTDETWKDARSLDLLKIVADQISAAKYTLVNADVSLICEEPKIAPHRDTMRTLISDCLKVDKDCIGIKATTNEGLGAIGRGEGIAAHAVVLLEQSVR